MASKLNMRFSEAIKSDDVVEAEQLLSQGIGVNTELYDWSPLMHAAAEGSRKIAELLIERGADVNYMNDSGTSVLHQAVMFCPTSVVKTLLEHDADMHVASSTGWGLLHACAAYGNVDTLRLLLSYGLDHNQADNEGSTPLMAAVKGNFSSVAVVQELFQVSTAEQIVEAIVPALVNKNRGIHDYVKSYLDNLRLNNVVRNTVPDPENNVSTKHGSRKARF